MAHQVIELKCPNCGDSVDAAQSVCKYCKQPIVISTFNSVASMPLPLLNKYATAYQSALAQSPNDATLNTSIALCYLKLKLYDKALIAFEKAIQDNFDNSETFFYAAVCILNGKKAFLALRPSIDKIEEYIQAALAIEPKGIYHYFSAYIKYDYFFRKSFRTSPNYEDSLQMAQQAGLSPFDAEQLYSILCVSKPEALK